MIVLLISWKISIYKQNFGVLSPYRGRKRYTMVKFTMKQFKGMVRDGNAVEITSRSPEWIYELRKAEKGFRSIGYSHGTYGLTGKLVKGETTGTLYVVIGSGISLYAL